MKKYNVKYPVVGYVEAQVYAESEKEAIKKALEEDFELGDVWDLNGYETLVEGHVVNVMPYKATAEEIEDD